MDLKKEAARIGASYNETSGQTIDVIPRKTRWLAILVGCIAFIAGSMPPFAVSSLVVPSTLILGAIIQPYSPLPGRWLLSVGAFFLSVGAVPYLALSAFGIASRMFVSYEFNKLPFLLVFVIPLILLTWCDVALILDARRLRYTPSIPEKRVPRPGDWLVFIAGACLNLAVLPGSLRAARTGRWDILALQLVFAFVVIWFDVALVRRAIRMRRGQRSGGQENLIP